MKNRLFSNRTQAHTPPGCALITGASQGLGLAFAHGCAQRGMDLLLVALPDSGLEEVAQALRATYGVRCEVLAQDLTAGRRARGRGALGGGSGLAAGVPDQQCRG